MQNYNILLHKSNVMCFILQIVWSSYYKTSKHTTWAVDNKKTNRGRTHVALLLRESPHWWDSIILLLTWVEPLSAGLPVQPLTLGYCPVLGLLIIKVNVSTMYAGRLVCPQTNMLEIYLPRSYFPENISSTPIHWGLQVYLHYLPIQKFQNLMK
jgi:hypothetical protein